ncbi:diaminopimelate decarboxylase [bacterium]|nr:diaminopimelate decarboxylase [bacterium]
MKDNINQLIKPITTTVNSIGHLEIGGCDLVELAKEYKTPLYVIDEATLRGVCKSYREAFSDYEHVKFLYASKALCTSAITKILDDEEFGFDVVSDGELYTVYRTGVDMKKILFNGNNKSVDELKMAIDLEIGRISVDNFLELATLDKIADLKKKKVDILLRITPGIECHTHEYIQTGHLDSKFGFDMMQIDMAVDLIQNQYKNLNLKGLHAHTGSQIFETKVYCDEIEILINELVRIKKKFNIELKEINIGGGLGVRYTIHDNPPSVHDIAASIINSVKTHCEELNYPYPLIYLEPGRSIISTAGTTLYTVGSKKQVPNGRKYVSVDGGMADNPRPSLYQAEYTAQVANKANKDKNEKVTIAGRYCESGDILLNEIKMPKLEAGDILCVYNTGAYNYSMSSNYNRTSKPAMVLVNSGQSDIIVNRETLEDIIRNDVIPSRLR